MFERFTERARQVIVLAQEAARELGHNYIGTEHLLVGLVAEEDGWGAKALADLGVGDRAMVVTRVEATVGRGDGGHEGQLPFTPRGKKVLELALREALSMGHNYIGSEHLLLALNRMEEGPHVAILQGCGLERNRNPTALQPGFPAVRDAVMRYVSGHTQKEARAAAREARTAAEEQAAADAMNAAITGVVFTWIEDALQRARKIAEAAEREWRG